MKKLKKSLKFIIISMLVLVVLVWVGRFFFQLFWNFDILDKKDYNTLYKYWERGGVFKTFKDCTLALALALFPIMWIYLSKKLYKYGLGKFLLYPIIAIYRKLTRPKSLDIEHVVIKNIGAKDRTIDEIISEKIKSNTSGGNANTSLDIRKQISAKIEENVKQ